MMRAKLQVQSVESFQSGETVKMAPVSGKDPYGPEGQSEDNTFARYTPSGAVSLTINNPELIGKLKPGMKLYADFTVAPE